MKKNIVQDVVFPKRSIRDVELPSRRKEVVSPVRTQVRQAPLPKREIVEDVVEEDVVDEKPEYNSFSRTPRASYAFDYNTDVPQKDSRVGLWVSLALFIIALGFGISALFVSARVTVTPRTEVLPVNTTLTATKDRPNGEFGYQVVSVSATVEKSVPAGSVQKVDRKATGTIIVYNNATEAPQRLIANTRFESSDGKVFRIANALTIPGKKTENGKTIPGSVEVVVTADQPGPAYNIPLSDFTVPGLKGDPRYTTVYARSKTPTTGGFSGDMKVVDATVEKNAVSELQDSLREKLKNDINSQIPANFVLFDGGISYEVQPVSQKDSSSDDAVLALSGVAHAVIFDRALLSEALVAQSNSVLVGNGQMLSVTNINALDFALSGNVSITQNITSPIQFTLTGDASIEWLFDEATLKNDLLGLKKGDLASLLEAKYPSIQSAQVKINPLWKQSFPTDPSKITIVKVTTSE